MTREGAEVAGDDSYAGVADGCEGEARPGRARSVTAAVAPSLSPADLTYPDFAAALRDALREFSRPDLLADNPLLRSRLLGANPQAGTADLRALLTQTVDTLFASPRDEKFRRVIDLTYFRPAPKQEAAADRLSLAFGTYRRHLTTAISRLSRWLWDREQAAWTEETKPMVAETTDAAAPAEPSHDAPRLSIVVLPFVNLGCCEGNDHFVDGITESLTTDLSRIPGSLVIARNTAFSYKDKAIDARQIGSELSVRYVMEGSVQSGGGQVRVNAQLIDAETGVHLWAERFDKPIANLFDMQDEITTRLARTLDDKLIAVEAHRAVRSNSGEPDALDHFFVGWSAFNRGLNAQNLTEAERSFERALKLDAENLDALVGLAMTKYAFAAIYATEERVAYLKSAETAAIRALVIAPDHARAHAALAYTYVTTNRPLLGMAEAERALSLDPNLAPCHAAIGWARVMLGRAEEAEVHIDKALRLSPRDSFASVWCTMAGTAKLMLGYHDEALAWLYRAIEVNQTYPTAHLTLAAALAWQGRAAEAQAAATAGLALAPSFNIRRFRTGVPSDNPTYLAQREHLYEGLRLARVPEGESRGTKVVHLASASAEKRHLRAEPERSNAVRFTRP